MVSGSLRTGTAMSVTMSVVCRVSSFGCRGLEGVAGKVSGGLRNFRDVCELLQGAVDSDLNSDTFMQISAQRKGHLLPQISV